MNNEIEIINPLEIIVLNDMRDSFDEIYDFIYNISSMSDQMNFSAWNIQYVDKIDFELIDQIAVTDQDALEMLFENFVRRRISRFELDFKLDDEGDILAYLPFEFNWKDFSSEFRLLVDGIGPDFLINSSSELVDNVYLEHAKLTDSYFFDDEKLIIHCVDISDAISKYIDDYAEMNDTRFTGRQMEVLVKKKLGISLSSTERDILSQIKTKIKKAQDIISEIRENDYLFKIHKVDWPY